MKAFDYCGYQRHQPISGRCYAPNVMQARTQLASQKIVLQSIRLNRASSRPPTKVMILDVLHHLNTLLESGIPILSAMDVLLADRDISAPLHQSLMGIQRALTDGARLSEAMHLYPQYYPKMLCTLIAAGEQSGHLTQFLSQALSHYRYQLCLTAQIKKAAFYPKVVFGVCCLIILGLLMGIVPRFEHLFLTLDVPIPGLTRVLIVLSHQITFGALAALVGFLLFWRHYQHRQKRHPYASVSHPIFPPLRALYKQSMLAQFSYSLSQLLSAGMTLQDSFDWLQALFPDAAYQQALTKIPTQLQQGHRLSQAMADAPWFPALMRQYVHIGEQSGTLCSIFTLLFERYDAQFKTQSERYLKLIEPLMMVGIGSVIALIMLALYWPIFHIGQAL